MPFTITGVPKSAHQGPVPPTRLEINDFVKHEKFFSLYIQALQKLFDRSQTDKGYLSYFQIAGIHGDPIVAWNDTKKTDWFCEHGTDLFPTWHRPYVALVEQAVHQIVVEIAKTYTTDTEAWKQAAEDLRQPYWDWAKNIIPPKEVIELEEVVITLPTGRKPVKNPYLGYKFNPVDKSFDPPFNVYERTLRYPTSFEKDAKSNPKRMKERLASIQDQITANTLRLFSINNWNEFSNGSTSSGSSANSLESIHGQMHNWIGGFGKPGVVPPGHMSSVPVAAFDPIFWLHHCQVDRILALWSAMHPDVWVGDQNVKNALEPFWNTTTTYWSSADCVHTAELNYSYPDFHVERSTDGMVSRGGAAVITPATTKAIAQSITGSYGHSAAKPTYYCHKDMSELVPNFTESESTSRGLESNVSPNYYNEWSARIRCDPFELGSSFAVYVFLGAVPSDPDLWYKDEGFVGVYDAFVNSKPENCANCRSRAAAGVNIEGFVHLNVGILKRSGQSSLEPEVIEPYLKENLRWAVVKADGTAAEPKSLEVEVLMTPLSLPSGVYFPVAESPKHYHNVTLGVPGGSRSG